MVPFKKEGVLKDGSRVILRPMVKEDRDKLLDFFNRVSDHDLMFLRSDVRDPKTIEDWVNNIDYRKVFPLLAEVDGKIVGDATLHMRKVGWKRHLGNIRIVIAKEFQGKGLGTLMVNELIDLAAEFGLEKLVAEIHLLAHAALATFKKAGFSAKAVFEDLVKDPSGQKGDLVAVLGEVTREMAMAPGAHPMELTTALRSLEMEADWDKVKQVVINLLDNAFRFSPGDAPVTVTCEVRDGTAVVKVKDRGPGVPPEKRDRLFEKFTQSKAEGMERGLGLGLYIVRTFVEAHAGEVWIEDEDGFGTVMAFSLPLGEGED